MQGAGAIVRDWIPLAGIVAVLGAVVFLGVFERLTSSPAALAAAVAASPVWVGLLSLVITTTVAGTVAWIAHQQWRTAHTKVALDIFKDRLAVYQKVMDVYRMVIGPGRPVGNEPFNRMHEARAEAQFLFGVEVAAYIQSLIVDMAAMNYAHGQMEAQTVAPEGHPSFPDIMHKASLRFFALEKQLPRLLEPYMQMDNTLPGRRPTHVAADPD